MKRKSITIIFLILSLNCKKEGLQNTTSKNFTQTTETNTSEKIYKKVKIDSGKLRIRESPNIESKVTGDLDNNEIVSVLEENNVFSNIGNKKGKWTKIKFGKLIGWVFGAYLIEPLKASENKFSETCYDIDKILKRKFGVVGKRILLDSKSEKSETNKYKENYNDEINLSYISYYGGEYFNLTFEKHTLQDVYKIFSECDSRLTMDHYKSEDDIIKFEFNSCDEPCSGYWETFTFKKVDNKVFVSFGGQT
ncbi:SH3 domain-containing protein [Leptospira mtsangambouensis]|uniref:SH3 domain-containing protein n=1 Tax=Leptospira mtsangambouensis TaxID=2484912 RepID=UPI001EEBE24D|nr:SH3 domain-containing protein [Leptospira mtsangambouensis]MCG6142820.1 SH3 domain-containing protein [Leptospira mtsangambouensis]